MTHFRVLFEKYDWDIEVCIIVENPNVQYILSRLEDLGCPDDVLHRAASRIEDYENSGFTFTNQEEHKSIIVINRPDSAEEFIDTYNHEKNHVEMHICKEFGIDPYSEKAAYLSGQLAKKVIQSIVEKLDQITIYNQQEDFPKLGSSPIFVLINHQL